MKDGLKWLDNRPGGDRIVTSGTHISSQSTKTISVDNCRNSKLGLNSLHYFFLKSKIGKGNNISSEPFDLKSEACKSNSPLVSHY